MEHKLSCCVDLEKEKNKFIKEYGFRHPEKCYEEETYRTNFRRQRDRILYSGGFRRLQDKTQVIAAMKSGDHRTRLTHTLEVEQIAISISDALGLNSDLVSAIALGHDVGHTPFGHAVENVLNQKLKNIGGFSHAVQSVKYLSEGTMNNSNPHDKIVEIRNIIFEGILKHDTDVYCGDYDNRQFDCSEFRLEEAGILEMQIVYWADKIAYLTHDFEDFYNTQIYINAKKSCKDLEKDLREILSNLIPEKDGIKENINLFETRDLIRCIISELIRNSSENIKKHIVDNSIDSSEKARGITTRLIKGKEIEYLRKYLKDKTNDELKKELSIENISELKKELLKIDRDEKKVDEVKKLKAIIKTLKTCKKEAYMDGLLINLSDDFRENYKKLRDILNRYYIASPEITRSDAKAKKIANSLFCDFVENYELLPLNIRVKIKSTEEDSSDLCSKERIVANYIASMTDRYAELIYTDLNAIGGSYDY